MDTFTFADPAWLWLLLLLPLAGWLKGATGTPPAVVYSSLSLVRQLQKIAPQKAGRLLWLLRWLALIVFILALARPQWGEGKQRIRASGIDIVVSMDLSDSMLAEDFQRFGRDANRLDVSKDVLEEFIKGRPSDRIGLIAFSGKAYIASPPTLNHAFLLENLDRFTTDTVPEEGTAIGSHDRRRGKYRQDQGARSRHRRRRHGRENLHHRYRQRRHHALPARPIRLQTPRSTGGY
jgi:Ca-activated chloride channel family protein